MSNAASEKSAKKTEKKNENYVNPVLAWSLIGGELVLVVGIALLAWL